MTRARPKCVQFPLWQRLILIAGMLLPASSLTLLVPLHTASADSSWPQSVFLCRAGNGGNGGIADHESSGADGATGGDCVNGPRGGDGASGGQNASPGGAGGNVV